MDVAVIILLVITIIILACAAVSFAFARSNWWYKLGLFVCVVGIGMILYGLHIANPNFAIFYIF